MRDFWTIGQAISNIKNNGRKMNISELTGFDWEALMESAGDYAVELAKSGGKSITQSALDSLKEKWGKVDWKGSQSTYKKTCLIP